MSFSLKSVVDNCKFHIIKDERIVSKTEGKTIFFAAPTGCQEPRLLSVWKSLTWGVIWNSLMAWPDRPSPPDFTTDPRHYNKTALHSGYSRPPAYTPTTAENHIVISGKI